MTESNSKSICRVESPTVDLLVISDLYLRAKGTQYPVADLPVETHDIVLSLGDVIDKNRGHAKSVSAGEAYEERGRAFLERLDEQGVPVLAVPGKHNPFDCTQRLSEELTNVHLLHGVTRNVVVGTEWSLAIAGCGCEQFDLTPALLSPNYPDIPVEDEARTSDAVAGTLLRAAGQYLAGDLSETNLAHKLGTEATNPTFSPSALFAINSTGPVC